MKKKKQPNLLARMAPLPLSIWRQFMPHIKTLGGAVYLPKEAAE
jgi:hypothetical protein